MKRFRCMKCNFPRGLEFMSDVPLCPSCRNIGVQELVDVHFLVPGEDAPIRGHESQLYVACTPARKNLANNRGNYAATHELLSVTCPKCKSSEEYRAAMDKLRNEFPELVADFEEVQTLKL